MGSPSLLHLVAVALVAAGCQSPLVGDVWTFSDGAWRTADGQTPHLTADHIAPAAAVLTLRMPPGTPSQVALDALIVATETGITQFQIGRLEGDLYSVQLPPPPTAARDFAVIHTGVSGMRVSAPGGAEHHVECDPCGQASDWSTEGVGDALDAAGTGEVLVSVSPTVPWGAALAAFEASGERTLRIGREL